MRFTRLMAAATLSAAMALSAFGQSNTTTTTSTDNQTTTAENSGHHRHRGDKDHDKMMDKMAKELNLTADQQSKLKDMHKNFADQRKAIKDDQSLSKDQKQAKMKDLREQMHTQMMGILTPDQQAKMKELHAENRGKRHHKKGQDNTTNQSQPNPGL